MQRLDPRQIRDRLEEFPDWSLNGEQLQRTFSFEDFLAAVDFVNHLADLAEEQGHYPDVMIRSGKVTLTVATHEVGGLSEQDFELARGADRLVQATNVSPRPAPVLGTAR